MKVRGSYDKAAMVKSFDDLTEAQKLRQIRVALKCGCRSCKAWLERIPSELLNKATGKG
jgi:hypothetical protein